MLVVGDENGNLYEFYLPTSLLGTISFSTSSFLVSCQAQNKVDANLQHTRLGHISYQTLSKILVLLLIFLILVINFVLCVH